MIMTASEVAAMLARDARGVAAMLLPSGTEQAGELCVGSVSGEPGKSLKVRLTGDKVGRWKDFAADGAQGDLLDLWASVRGLSISEALSEASDYLGVRRPKFDGARQSRPTVKAPKGTSKAADAEPVMRWLTEVRQFSGEAITAYRVAAHEGAAVLPAFTPDGKSIQYLKHRSIHEKKFWSAKGGAPCLFGWQAIPAGDRSVVICEGELDALAWMTYGFPALSPTNGAGNAQWIDCEFDHLARFDTIYLGFDMDEAGRKAIPEIVERLGAERCRLVDLPRKDANECLMDGVTAEEMDRSIANSRTLDPEELIPAGEFVDEVIALFHPDGEEPGVKLPWKKGSNLFAFRPGELTILAGVNGHGKSQIAGHITLGAMVQGERACIASMEFKPARWLAKLTRQAAGMPQPSDAYIRGIHDWYADKLWVFNATGTAKTDRIMEVFRYAVRRYGIRWFVVDNLAKCGISEDDYNGQKRFVEALSDFTRDYDAHAILCAHMRKGESEDKPAGKLDVKGTGAITDMADNVLLIWRNKRKEADRRTADQATQHGADATPFDETEKPDAALTVTKARNGEHEPAYRLWFCPKSNQYLDSYGRSPRQYVRWSVGAEIHQGEGVA